MRQLLGGFLLLPTLVSAQIRPDSSAILRPAPISLAWRRFDVTLTGPVRGSGYVSAIGRRAALIGTDAGSFEAWTWPLKLLHDFSLSFKTPLYDQPIPGRDIARRVEVSPAGATIVYTHSAFTVTERLFAPLDQPAVVAVLEVDAVRPIEIIARFRPDLQLAWPAGFGGQYVFWDDAERAFVLSESRRQVNGFFGSPSATWATNNPSHMLADAASELHIAVGDQGPVAMPRPGEPAGRLTEVHAAGIPIVMVGAVAPRDSVRAIYRRVLGHVAELYAARAEHAQRVLDSTVVFHSPDATLDLAVRWASLNLDEAMVCNPDLGCGLVAGYGPSGATGTRPGFGWFFGGDAAINSFAMSSAGLWPVARDGLAFFAGYQGSAPPNAGKIPHEISQGAARIRWFEDYPYAYYHGDTTPFWMLAVAEYWRASGDSATVRRLWPNLKKAYDWSKGTDADGDGLMDNAKAGAGAIEVGDLQKGLQSDIYMSAVWVRALEVFPRMADLAGDRAAAAEARRLAGRARASLREKLWLPTEGRYAFALLDDGTRSTELTVWPATGLAFGLFDDARGTATAASLARAAITTDWGARALASTSPLFDPLHYNNGTVWPFVTGFDAWGLYRAHNAPMGFAATSAVARTTFLWGLGANPEVFSGSTFEPLETAVPQQFFATSMLLTPLLRGMVGWEGDVPDDRVTLAPHLPPQWDSLAVERLPVGTGRYTVRFARTDTTLEMELTRTAGTGVDTLVFSPALPLGAVVREVRANDRSVTCAARSTGADEHVDCRLALGTRLVVLIRHAPGWAVLLPPPAPERGARSTSLKVVSQRLAGDALELQLEGLAGKAYELVVRTPRGERRTPVTFPDSGDAVDGYREQTIRVTSQP
ncbi:MAG TPA: GH116 family glycosyl hydrolase [Gemmatimonadales bacterium]|nr:GH116 family glycosyl hydrolase [Gemmatimonadales bacterium]